MMEKRASFFLIVEYILNAYRHLYVSFMLKIKAFSLAFYRVGFLIREYDL